MDPDHLAAVSVLIAGDDKDGTRRAGRLGLAWGAGHATTITAFGVPIVLVDAYLPEPLQIGTETLIGVLIMTLSVRLLMRYRREGLHAHSHAHEGERHAHLHAHRDPGEEGRHVHAHSVRSVRGSYGIGVVHGIGGSAGIGVLLLAAIPDNGVGFAALLLFAAFTAASMAAASTLLGRALCGRTTRAGRVSATTPALGLFNLAFGAWYALGALGALPYVL